MDRIKIIKETSTIANALHFFEHEDRELTLKQQIELVQIPAPSNMEKDKSLLFAKLLKEIDVGEVIVDDVYNVYLIIKGSIGTPKILATAHCDTVFPIDTDLTVKYGSDGKIYAPGICDDTRGMAEILSICRAVKKFNIKPVGDIILGCSVGEESLGDLRGIKHLFKTIPNISAFISLDGSKMGNLIYCGTGGNKYKITFKGIGGHSFKDFGIPNPAGALGRTIAMVSEMPIPNSPKTTFNIGTLSGGPSVNAIPTEAVLTVDLRSNGTDELAQIDKQFMEILEKATDAENNRFKSDNPVTFTIETISKRPSGTQEENAPIVKVALEVLKLMDIPYISRPEGAGSTDSNWAIHMGVPAITIGRGGIGGATHTIDEWFLPEKEFLGPMKALVTLLALSGLTEISEPII